MMIRVTPDCISGPDIITHPLEFASKRLKFLSLNILGSYLTSVLNRVIKLIVL